MENENQENQLVVVNQDDYNSQLQNFEGGLVSFLAYHNLPSHEIFTPIPERVNVFKNLDTVIPLIDDKEKDNLYIYLNLLLV